MPTDDVLVLPNNSNVILTAEQAAAMSEKNVCVVPAKSVQAGFAAMGRFLAVASSDENERAMLEELGGGDRRDHRCVTDATSTASRSARVRTSGSWMTSPSRQAPTSTPSCTRSSTACSPAARASSRS